MPHVRFERPTPTREWVVLPCDRRLVDPGNPLYSYFGQTLCGVIGAIIFSLLAHLELNNIKFFKIISAT